MKRFLTLWNRSSTYPVAIRTKQKNLREILTTESSITEYKFLDGFAARQGTQECSIQRLPQVGVSLKEHTMTRLEILPLCGNPSDERVSLRVRHQITMLPFQSASPCNRSCQCIGFRLS